MACLDEDQAGIRGQRERDRRKVRYHRSRPPELAQHAAPPRRALRSQQASACIDSVGADTCAIGAGAAAATSRCSRDSRGSRGSRASRCSRGSRGSRGGFAAAIRAWARMRLHRLTPSPRPFRRHRRHWVRAR
jgi:hypothetical protein